LLHNNVKKHDQRCLLGQLNSFLYLGIKARYKLGAYLREVS